MKSEPMPAHDERRYSRRADRLRSAGYDCTVRTVQRDLRALEDDFCLTVRKSKGRLHEWARHKPLEAA